MRREELSEEKQVMLKIKNSNSAIVEFEESVMDFITSRNFDENAFLSKIVSFHVNLSALSLNAEFLKIY